MADPREVKRVRQACLNCRRKKVRCSGDRPVCAFCARLGQHCTWNDSQSGSSGVSRASSSLGIQDPDLAARVALLESQLSVLNNDSMNSILQSRTPVPPKSSKNEGPSQAGVRATSAVPSAASHGSPVELENTLSPSNLPSPDIVQSLVDTYFLYCQNQPYCFFHETTFRQRLSVGAVPEYLLYSIMATSVRFSENENLAENYMEHMTAYSNAAWNQIIKYSFSAEDVLDLSMVQSMSLLAALDFTSGHQRLGWVKIGLSVRFAQGLRLYQEPDHHLRPAEQEEMRRTFWSVYILDRLVSTGPHRPPTFVDEDCTVQLPCHEQLYLDDLPCGNSPTLTDLAERPDHSYSYSLDNFALGVLMASSLGHIIRYSMKKDSSRSIPPWDHRSHFSRIYSSLLYFESYSIGTSTSVAETIQHHFSVNGIVDQLRAGHFIFSRALYHLNQCLLHHPFLLHQRFVACRAAIPPSFVIEVLNRSREHANQVTGILHEARRAGCVAESAWYGYCTLAAGIIHKLFQHHDDPKIAAEAQMRVQMDLDFLERKPIRWSTYAKMATALRAFNPEIPTAKALVTPLLLARKSPIGQDDSFWSLVDYGWLSDATKDQTKPETGGMGSLDMETLDIGDEASNDVSLSHKESAKTPTTGNEMKNILGDDMGWLFSELLGYEQIQPH